MALLALLALLALPIAGAGALEIERPYDEEAGRIIDATQRQLDDFTDEMTARAPGAEVADEAGETSDVPDFVAKLKAAARDLKERFDYKDSAPAAASLFLRRAKVAEQFVAQHPVLARAQGEWTRYLPRLRELAHVYHVDWDAEPESWQPARWTDLELGKRIDEIDQELRALGKALDGAAKSAGLAAATRDELKRGFEGLRGTTKTLSKAFGERKPAAALVAELLAGARSLSDAAGGVGLAAAAPGARQQLGRSLDLVARAFGLPAEAPASAQPAPPTGG